MKNIVLIVALLGGMSVAAQTPKTMTRVEIIFQSPDVPAGSFATKPKVMYRSGDRYCRVEEEPDPSQGIHGLMIINEPDYWMVNLMTKTARHGLDPGPTYSCHLPIFGNGVDKSPNSEAAQIAALEFGLELDYFKGKGATPQKGPVLQTKETTAYRLEVGTSALALFTYGTPERPLAVVLQRGEKSDIYWYSGYGQVDFDPVLFAKPLDVTTDEFKH
jgi:hypothetical protein